MNARLSMILRWASSETASLISGTSLVRQTKGPTAQMKESNNTDNDPATAIFPFASFNFDPNFTNDSPSNFRCAADSNDAVVVVAVVAVAVEWDDDFLGDFRCTSGVSSSSSGDSKPANLVLFFLTRPLRDTLLLESGDENDIFKPKYTVSRRLFVWNLAPNNIMLSYQSCEKKSAKFKFYFPFSECRNC